MKINSLLLKLFVFSSISISAAIAASGTLRSGGEITLKPQDQHALSVTRSAGKQSSDSNYDFTMLNSGEIIYEDKNQVDDIYLVFHDEVEESDRIKIYVNSGTFNYKISPINNLPSIVKNVLDPDVVERAKHVSSKRTEPVNKPIKKETKAPKTVVAPLPVIAAEPIMEPVNSITSSQATQAPVSDDFFKKFTKVFENLVETLFKSDDKEPQVKVAKESVKEIDKKSTQAQFSKAFDDSALKQASQQSNNPFEARKGIKEHFDDSTLVQQASHEDSPFAAPKRGISENFDDSMIQAHSQLEKKSFAENKAITITSTLPTTVTQTYGGAGSIQEKQYHEQFSKAPEQVPTFKPTSSFAKPSIPETVIASAEEKPQFTPTQQYVPAKKTHTTTAVAEFKEPVATEPTPVPAPIYKDRTEAYPDTGYKEGYESIAPQPRQAIQERVRPRVEEDRSLANRTHTSDDGEEKRLVITKIIDKEQEQDPFEGRVLGHIDDRSLGNGYDGAATTGRLGMRVTKNAQPVSAWVEVFKNGTKQRVKTFYTSKTSKAKSVKLPAGTYKVRATYRTRDSKQQKTINGIKLAAGDNINKKIAFHDGKLRVVARRGDKPLYVKVVAYKSGSRDRVGYDFSSRTSGVAELSLTSGRYDIEVILHNNNRVFDGIRISGGKTNTINVDF